MKLEDQWYAVALEDFQVTFLQQHINARAFNIKVNSKQIKEADVPIIVYDLTGMDEDQLIYMFFKREKQYVEKAKESQLPNHISNNDCPDSRKRDFDNGCNKIKFVPCLVEPALKYKEPVKTTLTINQKMLYKKSKLYLQKHYDIKSWGTVPHHVVVRYLKQNIK
tara:strand:- start:9 stop:503 length:495 start_codon:yes stop_codon:yes gene_type:complete